MRDSKRHMRYIPLFCLLIILAIAGVLGYYTINEGHNWGGDFALYIHQTESLLTSSSEELLILNSFSMENSTQMPGANPQIGPFLYPWGFPLLLLPVYAIFGVNLLTFKIYILGYFLLFLFVVYHLFKHRIGRKYSVLIVALLAVNPYLLSFLDNISSDIPYTFFALLAILLIQKLFDPSSIRRRIYIYILTGLVIFIAFLVRTNGIVLLGTLGVSQLVLYQREFKQGWKAFIKHKWFETLPYITFFILLLLCKIVLVEGSGSHIKFLSRVTPGKLAYNIMYYIELPAVFFHGALFPKIIFGISLPFMLMGIYKRYIADIHYISYSVFTLAVFIVWPPIQGLRFIFSLLPFYLYFTFVGFAHAEALLKHSAYNKEGKYLMSYVFCAYLLAMFLFTSYKEASKNFEERQVTAGPYETASKEMFAFITTETDASDIIVFFKPRVLHYLTRRPSIRVNEIEEVKAGRGDYLIYTKGQQYGQVELLELEEWTSGIIPVFENEDFFIYALEDIRPSTLKAPDRRAIP